MRSVVSKDYYSAPGSTVVQHRLNKSEMRREDKVLGSGSLTVGWILWKLPAVLVAPNEPLEPMNPCFSTLHRGGCRLALGVALVSGLHMAVPAQVFVNNTPILVPQDLISGDGPADVFPSSINVSGVGTSLTGITIDLFGYFHDHSPDVQIVVESPGGTRVLLMGEQSGGIPQPSVNFTFDDAASGALPLMEPIAPGSYKPTLHVGTNPFEFDAGGPTDIGSWTTTLSSFHGENPNGVWKLWVQDFATEDTGAISGGWGVNLTAVPEPHEYAMIAAVGLGVFAVVRRRRASR